jgi:hypothetical protein
LELELEMEMGQVQEELAVVELALGPCQSYIQGRLYSFCKN